MTAAADAPKPVTLIILAYNQEAFVEAAIAGALAQDYPALEIILSDDGSSDSTFALMKAATADYRGPHRVIANQTPANSGFVAHIYHAVARSRGELIVLGAGDDISLPYRVSALVAAWRENGADALGSDWEVIDQHGAVIGSGSAGPAAMVQPWFAGNAPVPTLTGATGAYERAMFEALKLPDFPIFAEDFFFALLLNLRSRPIGNVPLKLVQYRVHGESLTHRRAGPGELEEYERTNERYAAQVCDLLDYVEHVAVSGEGIAPGYGTPRALNLARFRADVRHFRFRARWSSASPLRRFAELGRVRSRDQLIWMLPRILGLGGLSALQRLRGLIRR